MRIWLKRSISWHLNTNLGAHNIRIEEVDNRSTLLVHLDMEDKLRVEEAHARATAFEEAVQQAYPWLDKVVTHWNRSTVQLEAANEPVGAPGRAIAEYYQPACPGTQGSNVTSTKLAFTTGWSKGGCLISLLCPR